MTEERLNSPTSKQREYLADLLDRARKLGMPRITTERFTRDETSDWIAFLLAVLPREQRGAQDRKDVARKEVARKEEGSKSSPSLPFGVTTRHVIERVNHDDRAQYLRTPPTRESTRWVSPCLGPRARSVGS